MRTVGEAVTGREALHPNERKNLFDGLRRRLRLMTSGQKSFEEASARARAQAAQNSWWQTCHAPGWPNIPIDSHTGIPTTTDVKRWFCPQHVGLAAPGDLGPRSSGLMLSESGAIVPIPDPAETMRAQAERESRERQHQQRLWEREYEAEQQRREQELRDEMFRSELPEMFRDQ
jgi:hypothetical protein